MFSDAHTYIATVDVQERCLLCGSSQSTVSIASRYVQLPLLHA